MTNTLHKPRNMMLEQFSHACQKRGMRLTRQRILIVSVVGEIEGHPKVQDVYDIVRKKDNTISLGTVYRTLSLLEECQLVERRDFGAVSFGGNLRRSVRFENITKITHHDHLIDLETGKVLEFEEERIEKLQQEVAERLGYELRGHRLELYAVKKKP